MRYHGVAVENDAVPTMKGGTFAVPLQYTPNSFLQARKRFMIVKITFLNTHACVVPVEMMRYQR